MTKAQPKDHSEPVAEVANISEYNRDELSAIDSFDDALRLAQTRGTVVAAHETELGDGFRVATEDDKRRLCGVPLVFLEWTFREGDFGDDYVSVRAVSQSESGSVGKWILNDGGTGMAKDLREFQKKTGRTGGLLARRGLRVSDYHIDPETGTPLTKKEYGEYLASGRKTAKACTFYIDAGA